MAITATVTTAIAEIRGSFPECAVTPIEDGSGGAFVIIESVDPGPLYEQCDTWIGAQITFQYPYADVYPQYVRGDLRRVDGRALGEGTSAFGLWQGRSAVQLSRRASRLNPATDRAVHKFLKVLEWLRRHP